MTHRPIAVPLFLLVAGSIFAAAPAEAQIFTPTYLSPVRSSDIGVYLNDGPGEFSVEGVLRRSFGGFDMGFRAGVASTDDASVLLGLDYRNPVGGASPVALAVTGAVQGALGDASAAGVGAGLSVGASFDSSGITFIPYVHPRVALVDGFGPDESLELLADIGFDLRLSSLDIRFGITIDDVGADWGAGVAWR